MKRLSFSGAFIFKINMLNNKYHYNYNILLIIFSKLIVMLSDNAYHHLNAQK
jgi:hypothetical protein